MATESGQTPEIQPPILKGPKVGLTHTIRKRFGKMSPDTPKTMEERKARCLQLLKKYHGVISYAMAELGLDRGEYYVWCRKDAAFKKAAEVIGEYALDFGEHQLHTNMEKGDTTAIIFYLKTKGKKRGYIEKQEIEHSGTMPIKVTLKLSNGESKVNDSKD